VAKSEQRFREGLIFGMIAYLAWGLVPLYFVQVASVPAAELLAHRIVWSLGILIGLTLLRTGAWADVRRVLGSRRLLLLLLLSAAFLAGNWLLYISATIWKQVTEASIGYYMLPLVNAFFARVFLGEKLRLAHYPALGLIAAGVVAASVIQGSFTWLAVALPTTFGFYGLVRKKIPVESLTGLSIETLLLFVPSATLLLTRQIQGVAAFGSDWALNGWLFFGGVVTVVPLLTYTLSIRRLPLLAQSFIQFVSPTVQFLIAVVVLGEAFTLAKMVAMISVWLAVLIFIADAVVQRRNAIRQRDLAPMADLATR
jgi:chloramphenicol-sensitive protein RarD